MTNPLGLHDELIFAYIDGELNEQQSAELESLRASDPSIQKRIDALAEIHGSILQLSTQPPKSLVLESKGAKVSRGKLLAYAAILAIMATLFIYMNPKAPEKTFPAQRFYASITTDFVPDIVCDTPAKFEAYTLEMFGRTIAADFETPIELVGWKYLMKNYTPKGVVGVEVTRLLVGRTPDGTALLVIFPIEGFGTPKLKPGSDFHIYKRTINSVKVIEISPLDSPMLLDLLSKR